jgi:citrate lyase subunit beta/citryl-CoA lyase
VTCQISGYGPVGAYRDRKAFDLLVQGEAGVIIETARGVAEAGNIAAGDVVIRLALGNMDLATELGIEPDDRSAMLTVRPLLHLASAAAGIYGPVDGVTTSLDDADAVLSDSSHAASLGFRGKLGIHSRQLSAVRAGLAPSHTQVVWAQRILAAESTGEARSAGGAMVDRPVEERARDILRRAAHTDPPPGASSST